MADNACKPRTFSACYSCTASGVYRINFAGATFPVALRVYSRCVVYREGWYKTRLQQIALGRDFLPSPWTHTHTHTLDFGITRTLQANSSFKTQKRKFTPAATWPCYYCCVNFINYIANGRLTRSAGGKFRHEDHGREIRAWRTKTYFCQSGELEPMVTISFKNLFVKKGINLF
jgi:hypothetical protein